MRSKERLARNQEEPRIYRLTLDTVDKPNLQLIMYPGKLAEAKAKAGATKVSPEAAPDDDTERFRQLWRGGHVDVTSGDDDVVVVGREGRFRHWLG